MERLQKRHYLVIRLALWFAAVVIALTPVLKGIDEIADLREGESFRDLLFVTVPVSALALSATIDYLCVGFPTLSAKEFFNCLGSAFLNVSGLVTGLAGFLSIHDGSMSDLPLWIYGTLMTVTVCVGLATEILVSLNHHNFRTTD